MATKKPQSREDLLAALEALDTSTEVAQLRAEVARLTQENATLIAERDRQAKDLSRIQQDMTTIREAVRLVDRKTAKTHGDGNEAGQLASRMAWAAVRVGIQNGTHDPRTGLPYERGEMPASTIAETNRRVGAGDLDKIFPALAGPVVELSEPETAAAVEASGD